MASTQTSQCQLKANLPSTDAPKTWYCNVTSFTSENAIFESAPPFSERQIMICRICRVYFSWRPRRRKKKSWDASAPGSACEAVKAWIERLRSSLVLLLHSNCKIRAIQGVSHRNVLYISAHVQASCSCSLLSTAAKCCKAWTLRISLIMFNSNRHWLIRIIRHWNSMKFVNV